MADDNIKVTKESLAITRKLTEEQTKLITTSETLNPKFQTLVREIGKYSKGIATNTAELQLAAAFIYVIFVTYKLSAFKHWLNKLVFIKTNTIITIYFLINLRLIQNY